MSFFSIEHLFAGYDGSFFLEDISLALEPGQVVGLLGENGCGKTTFLKALCGILPHKGRVILNDCILETLHPKRLAQKCSYIPQRSGIDIDLSALDVVLMGFNPYLGLLEHPTKDMQKKAQEALHKVGLGCMINTNYQALSEGQRQLVILARTLITNSDLLLLDEPESALDLRHRTRMLALLQEHIAMGDRLALITLHDPILALNHCDRILLMKNGGIHRSLSPRTDALSEMEQALSEIYGPVNLRRIPAPSGKEVLVLFQE